MFKEKHFYEAQLNMTEYYTGIFSCKDVLCYYDGKWETVHTGSRYTAYMGCICPCVYRAAGVAQR